MKKEDAIDAIRAIEIKLNTQEVEDKLIRNPSFVSIRTEIRLLRRKLEFEKLELLADQLESFSSDLVSGIKKVQADLKSLTAVKKTIDNLNSLLGIVARAIALAA